MYPEEDDIAPAPSRSSSDLLPRIVSAIVLIPLALAALYYGGYFWAGFVAVCLLGLGIEWSRMVLGSPPHRLHQSVFLVVLFSSLGVAVFYSSILGVGLGATAGIMFMAGGMAKASKSLFWLGFGAAYLSVAAIALHWLRIQVVPSGFILVLFLLIVVWFTDIGAYFVGRALGGPKIFPSVSPNKTWSGSIGGIIIAALGAVLLKPAFGLLGPFFGLFVAAIGLSCVSQAGDALESALKRQFDIKDSGNLIPGHGGVLDRLDALLLAAPVMAAFVWVSQFSW